MALHVTHQNNIKVYTIASSSKTAIPEWLAQTRKKELRGDTNWSHRIELVQDFGFPEASIKIKKTRDDNYIMATGTYKPQIRVYDLAQASVKFERHYDSENVQFEILSNDWTKFAMLQSDRTIEFHTQMGCHYKTRIPKFGRDMKHNYATCDLLISGASNEIYRLNLERGQFLKPFETECSGVNVLDINPANNLLGFGGEDSCLEFWDPRQRKRLNRLNIGEKLLQKYASSSFESFPEISSLKFHNDGLTYAVGTSTGQVMLFDLRSSQPLFFKDHQYEYPIKNIQFHHQSGNVISADSKVIKIWNKDTGKMFTSIEPENDMNDMMCFNDSGLIMTANEGSHMNIFFCPALGPAPKWCSFLDSMTEELEERPNTNVWDDYKFVTKSELSKLGLEHLIGTNVLKAYMHGYFVDLRLYDKARAVANPFEYQEYRKRLVKEKLDKQQESRISATRKLPKVNRSTAEYLLSKAEKIAAKKSKEIEVDAKNPLGDDRFAELFQNPDFQIDEYDPEYVKFHTAAPVTRKPISDEANDIAKHEEESEMEGKRSDESSSDAESDASDELISKKIREQGKAKNQQRVADKDKQDLFRHGSRDGLKMFEMKQGESWDKKVIRNRKNLVKTKRMTFAERLEKEQVDAKDGNSKPRNFMKRGANGAMAMTFKPSRGKKLNQKKRR